MATVRSALVVGPEHVVHLYDVDDRYYPRLVDYLATGLDEGRGVIVLVTEEHARGLASALMDRGIDVDGGLASGQLMLGDATALAAALRHDDHIDEERFDRLIGAPVRAMVERYGSVVALGEIVDVLASSGHVAAVVELEACWNRLLARVPATLWCAYQIANFGDDARTGTFDQVCAAHTHVRPVEDRFLAGATHDDVLARLQQQMHALRNEVEERRITEERLRRQNDVTTALTEALTMREVAGVALRQVTPMFGGAVSRIYLATGGQLELVAAHGLRPGAVSSLARVRLDADLPLADAVRSSHSKWLESLVVLPFALEGRPLGVLAVDLDPPREFAPDERAWFEHVAAQIAQALERARLFEVERAARERLHEFLAMLGHELRNPLAPILGAVELLRGREDPQTERARGVIDRQARHLARLVDDLLDLARVTRGHVELHRGDHDVATFVHRALEMASPMITQRRHHLRVDLPDDLPSVDVDLDRMAQVIANLVGNAAKYTPAGGHIEVSAVAHDGDVHVTVRDDGPGIAAELLPHVFEPFHQGAQALDRAHGGLGLGLTLVRTLTEQHGGGVAIVSEPGVGTEVTVRVPIAARAADAVSPEQGGLARTSTPMRVLVVDDNDDAAAMLGDVLVLLGHRATVVHDGATALADATARAHDVILLDLGLPGMDGFEVARQLRERGVSARLIAMTGYGQDEDRARTRAAGFDLHLVKPVSVADLEDALAAPV
jgi:signal transduction histidine kinase/CheY-like chemotaxis protein